MSQRFLIVPVFYGIVVLLSALVRSALLLNSLVAADLSAGALLKTFPVGLVMDLATVGPNLLSCAVFVRILKFPKGTRGAWS